MNYSNFRLPFFWITMKRGEAEENLLELGIIKELSNAYMNIYTYMKPLVSSSSVHIFFTWNNGLWQGLGSGFGVFAWMDPDPVFKFLRFNHPDPGYGSYANKSAERALKVIIRRKLKNYDWGPSKDEKRQQFLITNHHKIDGQFSKQRCVDQGSGSD